MPKKKSSSSAMLRGCQACCVIIMAIVVFFIMLFIQEAGLNIPFFNLVAIVIFLLAILMAIGILLGKCKPRSWRSWDMM